MTQMTKEIIRVTTNHICREDIRFYRHGNFIWMKQGISSTHPPDDLITFPIEKADEVIDAIQQAIRQA